MSTSKAITLMRKKGQRITEQRVALLSHLIGKEKACSQTEIEEALAYLMDRATMYRSLNLFMEAGLVLKIRDQKGHPMYVFNAEETHSEQSLHPHLKCTECDSVECLPAFPNDYVHRLEKYQIADFQIVLDGVCSNCKTEK